VGRDHLLYPPGTANTKFREARKFPVLEIGPEWRGLRRHGGGEAGSETGREAADLETWGGQSGCGRHSAREVSGVPEGLGRQDFRKLVFQKADIGKFDL